MMRVENKFLTQNDKSVHGSTGLVVMFFKTYVVSYYVKTIMQLIGIVLHCVFVCSFLNFHLF